MLHNIKGILIDLSGTLHVGSKAIGSSVEALSALRTIAKDYGIHVRFLSNTSKESKRDVVNRLETIGFDITEDEVTTSLSTASALVQQRNLNPYLILNESAKNDFSVDSSRSFDSVVVGLSPEAFQYNNLNEAFRLLLGGAPLIATHKGRYYRSNDDQLSLGPGAFVEGLEYASGCKAEVVGKPTEKFFLNAVQQLSSNGTIIQPDQVVMIGDDINDDVFGAMKAGLRGVLVRSGKYQQGDEGNYEQTPDVVVDDFSQFVTILEQSLKIE